MPDETEKAAPIPPKPLPHPKELSLEYHKAHKQLMLWATILFIWELVGVNLDKAKDAGGNIGPVVTALKSPQAVPWVLLILVGYFLFKCSIEWAQCHSDRRRIRFARADFVSAWIVAVAAIALYFGQAISRVQIADILQSKSLTVLSVAYGTIAGLCLIVGASYFLHFRTSRVSAYNFHLHLPVGLWVGAVGFVVAALFLHLSRLFLIVGVFTGAGAPVLLWYLMKLWRQTNRPIKNLAQKVTELPKK